MISQEQINKLNKGEKLIFFQDGGVLQTKKGNVFTFSNWVNNSDHPGKHFFQCVELHNIGNHEHNFCIYDTEMFDCRIHTEFVMMNKAELDSIHAGFITDYGAIE